MGQYNKLPFIKHARQAKSLTSASSKHRICTAQKSGCDKTISYIQLQ